MNLVPLKINTGIRQFESEVMTRNPKNIAIHEAGHAVMRFIEGFDISEVSIISDGKHDGHVEGKNPLYGIDPREDIDQKYRSQAFACARTWIAGRAAEQSFNIDDEESVELARDDLVKAYNLLSFYTNINEISEVATNMFKDVRSILCKPNYNEAIEQLSKALLKNKRLSGEDATSIIEQAVNPY